MKIKNAAVLTLALAAVPALAGAQASDSDFAGQLGSARALIQQEQALPRAGFALTTQESGPNDPLLRMQAPLLNLIKKVEPSTVVLVISGIAPEGSGDSAAAGKGTALCSGFFVDARPYTQRTGIIATNSHCVEMKAVGDEIQVGLYDGNDNRPKMHKARVLAYGDSKNAKDVAFVELEDQSLNRPALPLWTKLDVGEEIVAIGNPRGFFFSVSKGIVSALDRDQIESQFVLSADQTDAAVNPGNSGGPLFNMWGSVVGINAMIASESGGFEGLSFTVPARYVGMALQQYARTGNLKMGSMQVVLSSDADGKTLSIAKVVAGGPAAAANVRPKDQLVAVDGIDLSAMDAYDALREVVGHAKYMSPGETTTLTVRRDGALVRIPVVLGAPLPPAPDRPKWAPLPQPKKTSYEL